ncbi:MAG: D-alanyl-D-alanine carboxypeptidase family protein [Chloroflexota bacterium]
MDSRGLVARRCLTRRMVVAAAATALASAWLTRRVAAQAWQPYAAPAPPAISARAAYVYDATSGTPLFALNEAESMPPASLTKIVSALVVMERGNLDDVVSIQADDLVGDDESRVGLVEGDSLTVRDLLAGMLIPSGSDAAKALARHVGSQLPPAPSGDPRDAFIAAMNDEVAMLGLPGSNFENPHGLDGVNHVSTARDLALLTARAMQNPVFAQFVATATMTLPSALNPEGYTIYTTNDLLVDGTAIGVKTGTTEKGGGCLVTATTVGANIVIFVVLGAELTYDENGYPRSPARYADTRLMISGIAEEYDWLDPVVTPGLPEELAAWSAALPPGAAVPAPKRRIDEFGYRLVLGPAANAGDPVGRVMFTVGSEILSERQVLQV